MPDVKECSSRIYDTITATIANGATTSGVIDMGGASMAGLIIPASFTGTAISFKISDTFGGTYVPLKNSAGTTVSFTVSSSSAIGFDPTDFAAFRYFQIVSNNTEVGDKAIKIIPRPAA